MRTPLWLLPFACLLAVAGCSSAPSPESAPPPAAPAAAAPSTVVSGAPDTTGSIPGSANALYTFRFKQTDPASDRFTFRDRDVSFYFRPAPSALGFKLENLQGRPVWINWDRCTFVDVNGRTSKVAHATSRWRDRYNSQANTSIAGQTTYSDYLFPSEYLLDPGAAGADAQPHLPIVPEDSSAPTYSGRTFGVDLELMIEDRPRTYSFRFTVASVIPR
ncbi:MAG: hypothetical protein U0704_04170 [Candidatus Eisenbacteria bacterium]